jgi:hypothetical protein
MTTNKNTVRHATIALNLPAKVPELIVYANNVSQKVTGNPNFPNPPPVVSALTTATQELSAAETAALSRTKGAAAVRNEKRTAVVGLLRQAAAYVQSKADEAPENAPSIIQSSGFNVRKITIRTKRAFAVKHGAVSGSVVVTAAAAGPRSSYEWGFSVDGSKTWVQAPSTIQGKTTIAGFVPGTTAMFRYRTVTPKGGEGDWTQPMAILVQ